MVVRLGTAAGLLAAAALCVAPGTAAMSKRVQPDSHGAPRKLQSGSSCANLPGVWTGFMPPTNPLYDSYELAWLNASAGMFTAVYVGGGQGWTLAEGQLSSDNSTVVLSLDAGGVLHGNVSDDCSTMMWDNDSAWRKTATLPKRVHVVAMNHLDVGYNGIPDVGLVNNVLNRYFTLYFPRAVAIAEAMHALNGTDTFIYTTHAWLLDLYLNCPANMTLSGIPLACPGDADAAAMRAAVARGDVVFHSSPFNIQFGGAASSDMLDAIFAQPKRLAAELGVTPPLVASLRDVPGAPRSLVPALARAGIPVLSIGVNSYAPRPQLPTPSVWREPSTNTSVVLIMTEQGQGYPLNPGSSPTDPGGMGAPYCVEHPASPAVLCWAFRTDNSGPPESVAEVLADYAIARWQYPGAEVFASTFDAWWSEFQMAVPSLPVTTQEMGETWLTGFAADPPKNAFYRAAARQYSACLAAGSCDPVGDARIIDFLRMLMKMPEHTWGTPSINDNVNYTNAEFQAARAAGAANYASAEASWSEQRAFGEVYALAALADHPLRAAIEAEAALLQPVRPNPSAAGYAPVSNPAQGFTVNVAGGQPVALSFDAATGALTQLTLGGNVVADATHWIGRLVYQTVNDTDVDEQHITVDGQGCCCCYGWDQMQKVADPVSSRTAASLTGAWASQAGTTLTAPATFLLQLTFPAQLQNYYGAPGVAWANYTVAADGSVWVELQMFNKTSTRLGEAIYLDFSAAATAAGGGGVWLADVLDHYTDPLDVVVRGSQHQHGVGKGVVFLNNATGAGLAVDTIDAPVWSPWTATNPTSTMIVPYDPLTGPVEGFSCVLFSNIYNTNFPLYSVDDAFKFRFHLHTMAADASRAKDVRAALHQA